LLRFFVAEGPRNEVPPRTVANSDKKYGQHRTRANVSSSNPASTPTTDHQPRAPKPRPSANENTLTASDFADIIFSSTEALMNHYSKDSFRLTQSVGFAINKARNLLVLEMDAALKELDISSQQMGILFSLTNGVATTPFELSKLLGVDTGLMTRMLDKLEDKGLLQRSRSLEDRRVVNLTLTAKGQEIASRIPEIAPGVLNARLKNFSKAEFEELRRLLRKFLGD
jgi:DNA-binding MarR family transcriptional regulator